MSVTTSRIHDSRPVGRVALAVHASVVAVLGTLFLVVAWPPSPDANIGAGILALPLLAFGAPWSLLSFFVPSDHGSQIALVASALLNVALHALVVRRRALGETSRP
jgi:hypothetical protein